MLDYESRFREAVIDRFAESYIAGETPVPCIACNHAGQVSRSAATPRAISAPRAGDRPLHRVARAADGSRGLYRARDDERDQSYFPVRHHARSNSTCCAFRSAICTKAADPRARAPATA